MKKLIFFLFVIIFMAPSIDASSSVHRDNVSKIDSLTLYPVPAIDKLTVIVSFPTKEPYALSVYNVMGEKMCKENFLAGDNKTVIDLQKYPKGTYCLLYVSNGHSIKRMFVKK